MVVTCHCHWLLTNWKRAGLLWIVKRGDGVEEYIFDEEHLLRLLVMMEKVLGAISNAGIWMPITFISSLLICIYCQPIVLCLSSWLDWMLSWCEIRWFVALCLSR